MAKTQFAGLVTPNDEQKVAIPADMWALANGIDTRLNLVAANQNDRDARYQDVPAGTLVSTPDGWQWLKLTSPPAAPSWKLLHSRETFTGFAWTTGFDDAAGRSSIFHDGSNFDMYIETVYTGDDVQATADGSMVDTQVLILPAAWRPRLSVVPTVFGGYPFSGWGILYASTGSLNISDARPNNKLTSGMTLTITYNWTKEVLS